jgi:transcriptional regulator with XRE-family HTH domain
MAPETPTTDLERLGTYLAHSRVEAGLSQAALAARCGLAQQQVSFFEAGLRIPTLPQALRIARTLDIPIQRLLTGSDRPGAGPAGLAIELRRLGVVDLRVGNSAVPGSFRRPEEVINLAIAGEAPDPRIVEAIPAALAWADLDPDLLVGHAKATGTTRRLAWLADVALAIDRQSGFPGGCRKGPLERFLRNADFPGESEPWEDLGKPAAAPSTSPLWRRWKITYDAELSQFRQRAEHLQSLRIGSATRPASSRARIRMILRRASDTVVGDPPSPPTKKPLSPKKDAVKRAAAIRMILRRGPDTAVGDPPSPPTKKPLRPKKDAVKRAAAIRRRRRLDDR